MRRALTPLVRACWPFGHRATYFIKYTSIRIQVVSLINMHHPRSQNHQIRARRLALVLHRTSDMNSLAGRIRRRSKEDECDRDFDRHTGSAKRRWAGGRSQAFQSLGIIAFGGWLQRRPDDAGRDGVDTNTLGGLLLRESASEAGDGALGCAVVDHGRVACVAGDGAAVDDD